MDSSLEEFRMIEGYEHYQISNLGRVFWSRPLNPQVAVNALMTSAALFGVLTWRGARSWVP